MVEGLVETVRIKERNSYVHKVHASQRLCDIAIRADGVFARACHSTERVRIRDHGCSPGVSPAAHHALRCLHLACCHPCDWIGLPQG